MNEKRITKGKETQLSVLAVAVINALKQEGRTVSVTRYGDAPIVPYEENKFLYKVLTDEQIEKLHKEIKFRLGVLDREGIPYTHVILAEEVKDPPKPLIDREKAKKLMKDVGNALSKTLGVVGTIAGVLVTAVLTVALASSFLFWGAIVLAAAVLGVDPIVYARLPSGEWVELARYYD